MYKRGLAAKSWNSTPSSTLAAEAAAVIFPRPLPQRQTIKLIGKVFYDLSGGAVWGPHMVGAIVVVVFGLTHLFGRGFVHTYCLVNMDIWKGAANGYSSSFRRTGPKFRKIFKMGSEITLRDFHSVRDAQNSIWLLLLCVLWFILPELRSLYPWYDQGLN